MAARSKYFDPRSVRTTARSARSDVWTRLVPVSMVIAGILLLVLLVAIYRPVLQHNTNLQSKRLAMEAEIERIRHENLKLADELYALQHDKVYVERMARDILNYGREGETIYIFPPYRDAASGKAK